MGVEGFLLGHNPMMISGTSVSKQLGVLWKKPVLKGHSYIIPFI